MCAPSVPQAESLYRIGLGVSSEGVHKANDMHFERKKQLHNRNDMDFNEFMGVLCKIASKLYDPPQARGSGAMTVFLAPSFGCTMPISRDCRRVGFENLPKSLEGLVAHAPAPRDRPFSFNVLILFLTSAGLRLQRPQARHATAAPE